jgi:hypothetical protein
VSTPHERLAAGQDSWSAGDRTVERHSQADMLDLMVQIGAVPAAA